MVDVVIERRGLKGNGNWTEGREAESKKRWTERIRTSASSEGTMERLKVKLIISVLVRVSLGLSRVSIISHHSDNSPYGTLVLFLFSVLLSSFKLVHANLDMDAGTITISVTGPRDFVGTPARFEETDWQEVNCIDRS
jgi:hypothetical protein